mmetsp:Transcript_8850/g.15205  ORF Transcript_8850/g.15205 Transcript_8850/m.15205 type:complete len:200 (+) Transcript_8850:358-957(+)
MSSMVPGAGGGDLLPVASSTAAAEVFLFARFSSLGARTTCNVFFVFFLYLRYCSLYFSINASCTPTSALRLMRSSSRLSPSPSAAGANSLTCCTYLPLACISQQCASTRQEESTPLISACRVLSSMGVATSTRRMRLRVIQSALPMKNLASPPFSKRMMRWCSRNRPITDTTRMLSLNPGTPGRMRQMPRTMRFTFTPA